MPYAPFARDQYTSEADASAYGGPYGSYADYAQPIRRAGPAAYGGYGGQYFPRYPQAEPRQPIMRPAPTFNDSTPPFPGGAPYRNDALKPVQPKPPPRKPTERPPIVDPFFPGW